MRNRIYVSSAFFSDFFSAFFFVFAALVGVNCFAQDNFETLDATGQHNPPPFTAYTNHYLDRAGTADTSKESASLAGWGGPARIRVNTDLANVRSGKNSIQVSSTNEAIQNTRFNALPFTAKPGETITVGMWFKAASNVRFTIEVGTTDSGGGYQRFVNGNGGWQYITHSVVSNGGPTRFLIVPRGDVGITSADVYVDDIEVTITGITPPDNFTSYFGGRANAFGYFMWDFSDPRIDVSADATANSGYISNQEFRHSVEYIKNSITKVGDKIRLYLNPTVPAPSGRRSPHNFRTEISEAEWDSQKLFGSEEWIGFSYEFGSGYIPDTASRSLFYQNKTIDSSSGGNNSPAIELMLTIDGLYGSTGGEIAILHDAGGLNQDFLTGVFPTAGQTIDVVIHIIYGDETNGLLEVWLDGVEVYSHQDRTVYPDRPWGGNNKFGVYKFDWNNNPAKVAESAALGITEEERFLSQVRIYRKRPDDPTLGRNEYHVVKPRSDGGDDNDVVPRLTLRNGFASERDGELELTIEMDRAVDVPVSVAAATQDRTGDGFASRGVDHYGRYEVLTIPAGQTRAVFRIQVLPDDVPEGREDVLVRLFNPQNATIATGWALGVIRD